MTKLPIGEFLAYARKEKGLTQREVAELLGISNRTVSAWEQGRAYPDVLSLSQLAEIYDVTADEILKGEKAEPAEPTESDNSQGDITGSTAENAEIKGEEIYNTVSDNYCSAVDNFSFRSKICIAVQCCGALFLCGSIVAAFYIMWLGILLAVLGVCALIVALIVQCAFPDRAKKAVGLHSVNDIAGLTEMQRQSLLAIGGINARSLLALGCVWCVLTVVFVIIHRLVWVLPLAVCIAIFVVAATVKTVNVKRYGNMPQLTVFRANGKLLKKCLAFTAIPVVLAVAVVIFFAFWRKTEVTVDFRGDSDGFVDYMHTAALSEENYSGNLPYGEYVLDLSAVTDIDKFVRVHEYFFAVFKGGSVGEIDLYVAEPDPSAPQGTEALSPVYFAEVRQVSAVGDVAVYNVRYGCGTVEYADYVNVERALDIKNDNGEVTVTRTEQTSYFHDYLFGGIIICICSAVGCAGVYFGKRKPLPT